MCVCVCVCLCCWFACVQEVYPKNFVKICENIFMTFVKVGNDGKLCFVFTRWSHVTLSSPGWRSLSHLKWSLRDPKKVTKTCQVYIVFQVFEFFIFDQIHPILEKYHGTTISWYIQSKHTTFLTDDLCCCGCGLVEMLRCETVKHIP